MDLQLRKFSAFPAFKRSLVLASVMFVVPHLAAANEWNDIRQVQTKIQSVVKQNMKVSVVVTDGIGYGSGVVVSADGLVLTAGHVLTTGGSRFRVIFPDGREVKAKPLGKNLNVDAGMVLITEDGPWPYAELGDISKIRRGDWCVCLGHSGGYELGRLPPVRAGRVIDFEPDQVVTDCALIGGDSGGPLFDLNGRVIGINSSIGSSVAENRHVSVSTFKRHWKRMSSGESWGILPELDNRRPRRAALGIRVDRNSNDALITKVHEGGAADAAGMQDGDIVLQFDGVFVDDANMLIDLIKQRHPGDEIPIRVRRDADEIELIVTLREQE